MEVTAAQHIIHGPLNHLSDLPLYREEKPYEVWIEKIEEGVPRSNVRFQAVEDVPLQDIRDLPQVDLPTLEEHGFEVFYSAFPPGCNINSSADVGDKPEQREAMQKYLEGTTQALVDHYNGKKAVCYDWRVRRALHKPLTTAPSIYSLQLGENDDAREAKIDVAHQVHADSSPDGSKKMLKYLLSDQEKDQIAQGYYRLRLINVWRPIVRVVQNEPLAYCDVRTVAEDDWEPVEKIQEDWIEEAMYLKHRPGHKWYWKSLQTRDEISAFTIWDSKCPDQKSASTAHCSVPLSGAASREPRESIEVRFLLWTED